VEALATARDDAVLGCDLLDFFSAIDEVGAPDGDHVALVAHLWSVDRRHGVLIRTRLDHAEPRVATAVGVYVGAAWHEREAHEMVGVVFEGNEDLRPLLLPPEFDGRPLRKGFVLAARVAKAWPGAKEPGESDSGAPSRRRIRPPGVPDPAEWGPDAPPPTGGDPTVPPGAGAVAKDDHAGPPGGP